MRKKSVKCEVLAAVTIVICVILVYLDVEKGISLFKYIPMVVFGFIGLLIVQGVLSSIFSSLLASPKEVDYDAFREPVSQLCIENKVEADSDAQEETQDEPVAESKTEAPSEAPSQQYSCLDRYEALQEEAARKEVERRKDILNTVNEYVTYITAGYLTKKSLATLLTNIEKMACGEYGAYIALRSDMENKQLKSPDLRHLAWNIGERLGVPRKERAAFIQKSFPYELSKATLGYLELNLRDLVPSHIKIDVPLKDDYRFEFQRESA
jgi:hypothetical protein